MTQKNNENDDSSIKCPPYTRAYPASSRRASASCPYSTQLSCHLSCIQNNLHKLNLAVGSIGTPWESKRRHQGLPVSDRQCPGTYATQVGTALPAARLRPAAQQPVRPLVAISPSDWSNCARP